jgi:integrase
MASLQARHARSCPLRTTTADPMALAGCTCKPTYWISVWEDGRQSWQKAGDTGKDRRQALRELARVQTRQDEGSWMAPKRIAFEKWADEWLASLECKASTKKSYVATLNVAKPRWGRRELRKIGVSDIRCLLADLRSAGRSSATRARHLRCLHALFEAGIASNYCARNPVAMLTKSEKPRPTRREAAYFTDAELSQLLQATPEGLWRTFLAVLVRTGTRLGEATALTWADVDMTGNAIQVRRTFTDGRLGTPKSGQRRTVRVGAGTVRLLADWWAESGRPDDDMLVFGAPGHVSQAQAAGALRRAMTKAGIPTEGPDGKRTIHSLRHSYARVAIENGRSLVWLQHQLGHSVIATTMIYGHFAEDAAAREAETLDRAFTI